jgi:hypothetical protein
MKKFFPTFREKIKKFDPIAHWSDRMARHDETEAETPAPETPPAPVSVKKPAPSSPAARHSRDRLKKRKRQAAKRSRAMNR